MSNEAERQQLNDEAVVASNRAKSHKARHAALKAAASTIGAQKEIMRTAQSALDGSASGVTSHWKGQQADRFKSSMDRILDRIDGHVGTVDSLHDSINNEAAYEHSQYEYFRGNADRLWTKLSNLWN